MLQLQAEEPFGATLLRTEHELRKASGCAALCRASPMLLWSLTRGRHCVQQMPFVPEQCQVLFGVGAGGCTGLTSQECVVAYKNQ